MVKTISEARKTYEQRRGRRDLFVEQMKEAQKQSENFALTLENTLKARAIVQAVAKATQEKIEVHISNLVTMALSSVFPDPYEFRLQFVERRNSVEADFIFSKNGNEIDDILASGGGGVADIANFALKISLWSLRKTRGVFIDDEPDKFIHNEEYQRKTSQMMKMLCQKLGIQIIIVSDQKNIIEAADNIIDVKNANGESFISTRREE